MANAGSLSDALERDQREHRELIHERLAGPFNGSPPGRGEIWHEGPHGNAAGDEISERHHRLDFLYAEVWELTFEALSISFEDDPRQCAIRIRQRAFPGEVPTLHFRFKWFVMQMSVDESRPRGYPRFDHDDTASRSQAPRCFIEEALHIRDMVEDISHHNGPKGACRKGQILGICH